MQDKGIKDDGDIQVNCLINKVIYKYFLSSKGHNSMLTKWYPLLPHVCMAMSLFRSGKPQNHSNKNFK